MLEHQHLERLLCAAAGLDDLLQALALLGQNFVLAAGLGFELGVNGGCFGLGFHAALFGLGFGIDDNPGLLALAGASNFARCSASTRSASASAALAIARF